MKYLKYLLFILLFVVGCASIDMPTPAPHIGPMKTNFSNYVPRTVNFPANFTTPTTRANCSSNPGESDAYTVAVAGSSIGTVTLSTSCVATLATTGSATQSCTAGQQLTVTAPATVSGSNISITLAGTR